MNSAQKQSAQNSAQITIGFLLGWTLLSGMLISLGNWLDIEEYANGISHSNLVLVRTYQVAYGITAALVVAGAVKLVKTNSGAKNSIQQLPGHWILYGLAIENIYDYLTVFGSFWAQDIHAYNTAYALSGFFGIGIGVTYAFGAMSTKERWWRWYLAAISCVTFVQSAWSILYATDVNLIPADTGLVLHNGLNLVAWLLAIKFALLVLIDLLTRRKWDWLHWAAIFANSMFILLPWIYYLFYFMLE